MGQDINQSKLVGGKRKNGHKYNCQCHICENMRTKPNEVVMKRKWKRKKKK